MIALLIHVHLRQIGRLSTCFFISSGRNSAVYAYVRKMVVSILATLVPVCSKNVSEETQDIK